MKCEAMVLLSIGALGVFGSMGPLISQPAVPSGGQGYTLGLSAGLVGATLLHMWLEARSLRSAKRATAQPATCGPKTDIRKNGMVVFGLMAAYALLCPRLGYAPATAALYVGLFRYTGYRWLYAIAYSIVISTTFWWLFASLAKVSLP